MRATIALLFLLACEPHVVVQDNNGTHWFENGTRVNGATPDIDGTNVNTFVTQTLTYYQSWKSVLPKEPFYTLTVNAAVPNANGGASDATHAQANFADDYVTLDVVAHETTHAVVDMIEWRRFGTRNQLLPGVGEGGAVNEGLGDIMGELVECANGGCDWLHRSGWCGPTPANDPGPTCTVCPVPPGNCGPNRNLSDPTAGFTHPAHRDDTDAVGNHANRWDPAGEVHRNAGLMNKVGWLLVNGGTHMGLTIAAIGDLGGLLRQTLDACGASPADYDTWAACMRAEAVSGAERDSVSAAWCSVGIGPNGGASDPDCRDADGDSFVSYVDCADANAPGNFNIHPGVAETCDGIDQDCDGATDEGTPDADHDGRCDSIDLDRDGDCVPNATDHCPDRATCNYYATDADHSLCADPCAIHSQIPDQIFDALRVCSFHSVPRQCMWDGCPIGNFIPRTDLAIQFANVVRAWSPDDMSILSGSETRVRFGRSAGARAFAMIGGGGLTSLSICEAAIAAIPKPLPGQLENQQAARDACIAQKTAEAASCNLDGDGDGVGDACE